MALAPKKKIFVGLASPLRRSPHGAFLARESTIEAVADDLKNLINTNYGERVIHYDFGANLQRILFENMSSDIRQVIADQIVLAVEKWMPMVGIQEITVDLSEDDPNLSNNSARAFVKFTLGKTGLESEVALELKNIR